jgi:hypothetical protein
MMQSARPVAAGALSLVLTATPCFAEAVTARSNTLDSVRSTPAKLNGRFAAWEQPELFAAELRAAFRSLR